MKMSKTPNKELHNSNEIDLREYQVKVKTEKGQIKSFQFNLLTFIKFSIYSRLLYLNRG